MGGFNLFIVVFGFGKDGWKDSITTNRPFELVGFLTMKILFTCRFMISRPLKLIFEAD